MGGRELHLVGLSHKSAPVAVREKVALSGDELKEALTGLLARPGVGEAMVVSTCNRVECYVYGEALEEARHFFLSRTREAEGHLYERSGRDAVRHLFRVASSLDSIGKRGYIGPVSPGQDNADIFRCRNTGNTIGFCRFSPDDDQGSNHCQHSGIRSIC